MRKFCSFVKICYKKNERDIDPECLAAGSIRFISLDTAGSLAAGSRIEFVIVEGKFRLTTKEYVKGI